jgi:signal transduction histidine kinase/HPt (histidine-containing phosphotransfer) domain-containing protein
MFFYIALVLGFMLLILLAILSVIISSSLKSRQTILLQKQKIKDLQDQISENKSLLSLTNDQMRIEISERKKRFEAYIQIQNELADRNKNRLNFLRNVGHEIRTPLNAINGMLTLLIETQLSEEQQEYLDIARHHSREMLTFLNDINDFSDIKRGITIQVARLSFNLEEIISSLHKHLSTKAQKKGIAFDYIISDNVPAYICGDPIKLRKILFNLTDNAIKFTKQGSVQIHVETIMEVDNRLTLEFQVRDTGIGISKKVENFLFQAVFCQADTSMSRSNEGLGLGLAVTRELVVLLGGKTSFRSEENMGSTFTFTAVFEKCPQITSSSCETQPPEESITYFSFSNLKILLIESNPIRKKLICRILTQIGSQVIEAPDLAVAIETYNSSDYQAIVTSFSKKNIPDDKWITAFQNSNFGKIPILALSRNLPDRDCRNKLQKLPIADWLEIPINTRDLIDCIETICRSCSQTPPESPALLKPIKNIIDKEQAIKHLGDKEIFDEVLKVFIDDLPDLLEKLKQALADNSFDQICMNALSLKSSAATIMAGEIKKIAFDLGVAGNERDCAQVDQLLIALEKSTEDLKHAYYQLSQDNSGMLGK